MDSLERIRRDLYPVSMLAEHYGVSIEHMPEHELRRLLTPQMMAPQFLGGCIPWERRVLVANEANPRIDETLHEVVHCITYLPTKVPLDGILNQDEADFLMPFERALALSTMDRHDVQEVVEYQCITLAWGIDELGSIVDYESHPNWLRGLRIAVDVGLLDEDHEPTLRRADWTRLSSADRRWLLGGRTRANRRAGRILARRESTEVSCG